MSENESADSRRRETSEVISARPLCERFCRYYKPDKAEDLACLGFLIVEEMMRSGRAFRFEISPGEPGPEVSKELQGRLCDNCPYHEEDCDFAAGVNDAPPCGGYLFLGHLLGEGLISVDDIGEIP